MMKHIGQVSKWAGLGMSVLFAILIYPVPSANADTVYQPSSWNGYKIYVSQACHDRGSGACVDNTGCNNYSENGGSAVLAVNAIASGSVGSNLLDRGYRVRKGDGLTSQNISNSNQWGANLHMALHSNAGGLGCGSTNAGAHGTWGLYYDGSDQQCANQIIAKVGGQSPGTGERITYRDDVGELRVNAPTCYFESEFHTWNRGVNFLSNQSSWSYKLGAIADAFFGR